MGNEYKILADPIYVHHINSKREIIEDKIKQTLNDFRINDNAMIVPISIYDKLKKEFATGGLRHREIEFCLTKFSTVLLRMGQRVNCVSRPEMPKIVSGPYSQIYNMFFGCFSKYANQFHPVVILRIGDNLKKYQDSIRLFFRKYEYECRNIDIEIFDQKHIFMICYPEYQ